MGFLGIFLTASWAAEQRVPAQLAEAIFTVVPHSPFQTRNIFHQQEFPTQVISNFPLCMPWRFKGKTSAFQLHRLVRA